MLRSLLRLSLSLCLWGCALWLSARFHLDSDIARSAVRDVLTGGVSSLIRGRLSVEAIEAFDGQTLTVHHAVLTDPNGVPVIRLRRATLSLASAAPGQVLQIDNAVGTDGELVLIDNGAGTPTFVDALSAVESADTDTSPSALALWLGRLAPTGAIVEQIALSQVRVRGELLGVKGIDGTVAAGRLDIFAMDEVDIRLSDLHGTLDDPYGFTAHIVSAKGSFSSDPARGIRVRARVERRDREPQEHVRAHVVYATPDGYLGGAGREEPPYELAVRIRANPVSPDTLTRIDLPWFAQVAPALSGRFTMHGPLDALHFESVAKSLAGTARVSGLIGDEQSVVRASSEGLDLGALMQDAPPVRLSGSAELTLPADADAQLSAELGPTRYAGLAIPSLALRATLGDDTITLDDVKARQPRARVSASGSMDYDGIGTFSIDAHFDDIAADPNLRKLAPDLTGSLTARLRVDNHPDDGTRLDVDGELRMGHLRFGRATAAELVLRGRTRGRLQRPGLDLSVTAKDVRVADYLLGDAYFDVAGGPATYRADGRVTRLGKRSVRLVATIDASRGRYRLNSDTLEVAVADQTWRGSLSDLTLGSDGSVNVGELQLADGNQRLELSAKLHLKGDDWLRVQLEDFDLALVHGFAELDQTLVGRADASLEALGDLSRPTWSLEGAIRGSGLAGIEGADGTYSVRYQGGTFQLDGELDLQDRGRLSAQGGGLIDAAYDDLTSALLEGVFTIDVEMDNLEMRLLPGLSSLPGSARASAAIELHGSPNVPTLRGRVAVTDVPALEGYDLSGTADVAYAQELGTVHFILDDELGAVSTGQLGVKIPLSWLQAPTTRETWLETPFHLQASLNDRPSTMWPAPLPQDLPFVASARGELELEKTTGPMTGHADLWLDPVGVVRDASCRVAARPAAHLRAALQDGTIRFALSGAMDGKQVLRAAATTAAPVREYLRDGIWQPHPLDAEAAARLPALEDVPWLCQLGSGDFTLSASVADALSDAPTLTAQLRTDFTPAAKTHTKREQVQVRSCEHEPARLKLSLTADAASADAQAELSGCGGGPATMKAQVPVAWPDGWPRYEELRPATGEVLFAGTQLQPLLDRLPGVLRGAAIAKGRVGFTGPLDDLAWDGRLDIEGGQFDVISMGQRLSGVEARLDLQGRSVELRWLRARSDDGTLAAQGNATLQSWRPKHAQLAVEVDGFPIRQEGIKTAWLSGSGAIETDLTDERARSAIKVHQLEVMLPDTPPASLQGLEPHPDVEVLLPFEPPAREQPYALEFAVDGTRGVRVRRNDFDTFVTTELAVSYLDPTVRLGGYIEFQRGQFEVLGKVFELRRGNMRFSGSSDFDPGVNLVASHTTSGGDRVGVTVSGTLSRPDIVFSSEACPGEAGALALLLTGHCADARDALQSSENAEAEFASGLLYGLFTLGARNELGSLIPNIALESGSQGYATRVRAGLETDALVPDFMRSFIKKIYVQGAVSTAQTDSTVRDTADQALLDFLIEVYFPHNIVGSGHFAPETDTWGLDVTWEP